MARQSVTFLYLTGLKSPLFTNVRLLGSWDATGAYSGQWTETPMVPVTAEDGCPAFQATVQLDNQSDGTIYRWGVFLDGPGGPNLWGVPTEIQDALSVERYRSFQLTDAVTTQIERYYFTYGRRLGANKILSAPGTKPGLQFSVWAPNARKIQVVFGQPDSGYISTTGKGIDPHRPKIPLAKTTEGIWTSKVLPDFSAYEGLPYMFEITNAQNKKVYRTDIFSRSQIGCGGINPATDASWDGTIATLDGTVSCSVITDPDTIRPDFDPAPGQPPIRIPASDFWAHEFTGNRPLPTRVEDLIIYELHIGALGFGRKTPGTLADAIQLLDYLMALGVNAVELLPMAEFSGNIAWGYGDTHHFVIESSAGGRDQYRHFVRECHNRGMAVIQDVVYNHFDGNADRAEWAYDSIQPEDNIYYWYEGRSTDYPSPDGGYLDNGSSGWTPRFWEEVVRQQFISSAAFLVEEMHVDGLRVDLTQAIHRDNRLHANGNSVGRANLFGQKLLREWSRTLKMIHPSVMLIAEDHTGWDAVTKVPAAGGLGFDATWFAAFYHSLIGDADNANGILKKAGYGYNDPLAIDQFALNLAQSKQNKVVFHESHDEAGNAAGTARTMNVAVNGASLDGANRFWAEMRSRLSFGLSLLSAGTPMFFMGEEIGAQKPYRYDTFIDNKEDLLGDRIGVGAHMFRFYQDLISLSRRLPSIRTKNIDILHAINSTRVIAFKRWQGDEQVLVVASWNNQAYPGYRLAVDAYRLPNGGWREVFNSDSANFGGANVGNGGATLLSSEGTITVTLPANGFVIFVHQP
ncbi:alpha-amylase family glycosyl hydrolase [Spirosoma koreense]